MTEERNERLLTYDEMKQATMRTGNLPPTWVRWEICKAQDAKSFEAGKREAAKAIWALLDLDKWRCKHDSGYYCQTCKSDIYLYKLPFVIAEIQARYGLEDKQK